MLAWSTDKTTKYNLLRKIHEDAWKVILTTFENSGQVSDDEAVNSDLTTVTFTERLLRSILDITSEQQHGYRK
jgi:hypothetical protein